MSAQEYSYLMVSMGHPSTPHSRNNPQSFSRGTRPYISRDRQNLCLAYSQAFSKICCRVDICSVVLRPRRKPQLVSSSFGSIVLTASCHALVLGSMGAIFYKIWGDSLVWNQDIHPVDAEVKFYKYRFPILFFRGVLKATPIMLLLCVWRRLRHSTVVSCVTEPYGFDLLTLPSVALNYFDWRWIKNNPKRVKIKHVPIVFWRLF